MEPTLLKFRSNNYSQNGEDGIIDEILDRLNIHSGWFCEFGAWDGIHLSNTYNLIDNKDGWNGVLIEGDDSKYEDLNDTVSEHPDQLCGINSYVTSSGEMALDMILDDTEIPTNFELLSIDIDGPDYFVWESVEVYKPKIVIIEINPELGSELRFISEMNHNNLYEIKSQNSQILSNFPQEREGERIRLFGTSFQSMVNLGKSKGYIPVSCTQNNIIFVQESLGGELGLRPDEYDNPSVLFLDEWAKGYKPFYKQSLFKNAARVKDSISERGIAKTLRLLIFEIKRNLF